MIIVLDLTPNEVAELENSLLARAVNLQRAVPCPMNDRHKVSLNTLTEKFVAAVPVERLQEIIRGTLQS